ncbi:LytR/AlgR family response regulator transcription factor [Candidatus Desulforudis audaxviator]|uniref:Stage 0 sporulation protein A homolog n=1 Tax=Desulforudis audaxviator (strain MP104C) TaxID=477974 RepID=B1I1G2_DESAP|nr:LytTR family DNA-binding domain-containing protein [Candidatus Desulforudis audaxviator]ACA58687.1 response regulator receiver protein [Candidatus Desulforudis audaxviator MP104C]AZK58687.1 Autolysis response regulater LytR [Candidatus Desulforudis audaxviator]
MLLRTLIVDDEYPAREELRYLLGRCGSVQVIGEAADAQEALKLIKAVAYDVIFLDIRMPGISGIGLARELRTQKNAPVVVFVTAYEEYALDAFGVGAVDYLIKPVTEKRLSEVIARLKERFRPEKDKPFAAVAITRRGNIVPVPTQEITHIYAESDRVIVCTAGERASAPYTLEELARRLPQDIFFRSHRSFIVNLKFIKEIKPDLNGTYVLQINDRQNSEVPVSRSRVSALKERLGLPKRLRYGNRSM